MKKLKNIILIINFLLIPVLALSQKNENPWQGVSLKSNQLREKLSGKKYYLTFVSRGSHFYHNNYLPGKLTLEDDEVYDSVMIRYNSYLDELVCFNQNINSLYTIDKFLIKEFEVNSPENGLQKFRKIEFTNFPKEDRYFLVLFEGEITLLAFYKTEERKTSVYKDNLGYFKDTEFLLFETFYTYTPETGFNKFPPFRQSFLNMYNDNKNQVRQIFRKNRLHNFDISSLKLAFTLIEKAGIKQ